MSKLPLLVRIFVLAFRKFLESGIQSGRGLHTHQSDSPQLFGLYNRLKLSLYVPDVRFLLGHYFARHRANNLKNVNFASHPVSSQRCHRSSVGCGQRAAPHFVAPSAANDWAGSLPAWPRVSSEPRWREHTVAPLSSQSEAQNDGPLSFSAPPLVLRHYS